jgi:hypothetical protein
LILSVQVGVEAVEDGLHPDMLQVAGKQDIRDPPVGDEPAEIAGETAAVYQVYFLEAVLEEFGQDLAGTILDNQ